MNQRNRGERVVLRNKGKGSIWLQRPQTIEIRRNWKTGTVSKAIEWRVLVFYFWLLKASWNQMYLWGRVGVVWVSVVAIVKKSSQEVQTASIFNTQPGGYYLHWWCISFCLFFFFPTPKSGYSCLPVTSKISWHLTDHMRMYNSNCLSEGGSWEKGQRSTAMNKN